MGMAMKDRMVSDMGGGSLGAMSAEDNLLEWPGTERGLELVFIPQGCCLYVKSNLLSATDAPQLPRARPRANISVVD